MEELKKTITAIVANDTNYTERRRLVFVAMMLADIVGIQTSIYIDEKTGPLWPIFAIMLPSGQVSWHMSNTLIEWDGHDTAEKLRRCREFVAANE